MIRCTFYLYIGRDFRESRLVVLQTLAGKDKLGLLSKVIGHAFEFDTILPPKSK